MAIAGANVPAMLRRIQDVYGQKDCKLLSVPIFRRAFSASIARVSAIAGWCGFGGELTDDQVNTHVLSVLNEYKTTLGDKSCCAESSEV